MYPTGSVRSRAGIVQAPMDNLLVWKHPYDQSSEHADPTRAYEYPQYQSCGAVMGSVRTVSARTGYIPSQT